MLAVSSTGVLRPEIANAAVPLGYCRHLVVVPAEKICPERVVQRQQQHAVVPRAVVDGRLVDGLEQLTARRRSFFESPMFEVLQHLGDRVMAPPEPDHLSERLPDAHRLVVMCKRGAQALVFEDNDSGLVEAALSVLRHDAKRVLANAATKPQDVSQLG